MRIVRSFGDHGSRLLLFDAQVRSWMLWCLSERISRISLPYCHHFNLNFYCLFFFNQLKLVVKKGNQTENLYIGESEFLFEPFHFFHVLCNQWACEAPQIISSRKKVIPELWSSHSTASPLINNKPSAGWRPHSWRASLKKGKCREKGQRRLKSKQLLLQKSCWTSWIMPFHLFVLWSYAIFKFSTFVGSWEPFCVQGSQFFIVVNYPSSAA